MVKLDKNSKYYLAIFIIALLFFILSKKNEKTLLSIIIIIIIGFYIFKNIKTKNNNTVKILNNDIKNRKEINDTNFLLKEFPYKLKYLVKDEKLMNIIMNIRFIKKFDIEKYTNIINYMDKFMKIYIYILIDRYEIKDYFGSLIDMRKTILEEFYSIFLIIPKNLTYIYNINSYKEIYKSLDEFNLYSKNMINTVERYGKLEKNVSYLEDTYYTPYDEKRINKLP
jgi:hypothetical protein